MVDKTNCHYYTTNVPHKQPQSIHLEKGTHPMTDNMNDIPFEEEFEEEFEQFLKENEDYLQGEYIMAVGLNNIVKEGKGKIKVLRTPSDWFGVTNPEDGPIVREKIRNLVEKGIYPSKLEI